MVRLGFERLHVYQLSCKLADLAWHEVRRWDWFARDTVGRQFVRAADSIGANIAEGYGRGSNPDKRRFVRIALGSLFETKHWITRAVQRNLISADELNELNALLVELTPRLHAYLRSIKT